MPFITLSLFIIILITNELNCEEKVYIRKSTKDMTFNEWQDFKRGIKLMKEKHGRNPLGYTFQANIHGWREYDGSDTANLLADYYNWQKCTHESYYFLVWHRMYLYFFEKILRKVSGVANLTVPYWDYSDPLQLELPQPFREPNNNISNPIYVSERCKNVNEGKPLDIGLTNPYPALRSKFFTSNKSNEPNVCHSFGGGRLDKPMFLSNREGLLERLPHDRIHVHIGGPGGYMADLCNAARDPIFWLHHAMIDRIWETWVAMGGRNPVEEQYLKHTFKFYDENGRLSSYPIRDFMDMSKLNYKYDSLLKIDNKIEMTDNEDPELYYSVDETKDLYINNTKHSIILRIKPKFLPLFESIAKGKVNKENIRFTLQTIIAGSQSDLIYYLYLNLPKHTQPYENKPNFFGTISLFDAHCIPRTQRKALPITNCFDVTENLFRILISDYHYNGFVQKYFNLTIIPKSCDTVYYPENEEFVIKFDRTLLIHYYL